MKVGMYLTNVVMAASTQLNCQPTRECHFALLRKLHKCRIVYLNRILFTFTIFGNMMFCNFKVAKFRSGLGFECS